MKMDLITDGADYRGRAEHLRSRNIPSSLAALRPAAQNQAETRRIPEAAEYRKNPELCLGFARIGNLHRFSVRSSQKS